MTLIISEMSQFGIVMVADNALTGGRDDPTAIRSVKKLHYIDYLNAGISMWGLGSYYIGSGEYFTYHFIEEFIQEHSGIVATLEDFAQRLTARLREYFRQMPGKTYLGFHLAGFVEVNGVIMPTMYHIRNAEGNFLTDYTVGEFKVGHDYPPQSMEQLAGKGIAHQLRNADYGPYIQIFYELEMKILPAISAIKQAPVPHPSLLGRLNYYVSIIKFISDLYESGRLLRSIGSGVDGLGLYPNRKPIRPTV